MPGQEYDRGGSNSFGLAAPQPTNEIIFVHLARTWLRCPNHYKLCLIVLQVVARLCSRLIAGDTPYLKTGKDLRHDFGFKCIGFYQQH